MKRHWSEEELVERWTLFPDELALLANKSGATRLGFAVMIRFFAGEGRFPQDKHEVPTAVLRYVGEQVDVEYEGWLRYDWGGRTIKYHRAQIRDFFGFREPTSQDGEEIAEWLAAEILPYEQDPAKLREAFYGRCWEMRVEPPAEGRVDRLISSATHRFEERFCQEIFQSLSADVLLKMDALLAISASEEGAASEDPTVAQGSQGSQGRRSVLAWIKSDPGRVSLESVLDEIQKLRRVRELGLKPDLLSGVSPKVVRTYRDRAATEAPSELKAHPPEIRAALMGALCYSREREITDSLVDLVIQLVHRIDVRAERRVEKELLADLKRVNGKTNLLFRMAEAATEYPDGTVREVLYPVIGEETLNELVKESKSAGPAFKLNVHARLKVSYRNHYRQMLPHLLEALDLRSNNTAHRPVVEAVDLLREYSGAGSQTFAADEEVPLEGVVPPGWRDLVFKEDAKGAKRVSRVDYEVCVLKAARESLRRREIWVVGADRYRDPDEDLPLDFDDKREAYYADLGQPLEAESFVEELKETLGEELEGLDADVPENPAVNISSHRGGRILLSPLTARPEPPNLNGFKAEVGARWPMTGLLDILKEADLRADFTGQFTSAASREILDPETLQRRLLLCLYGLGTNMGLKRMAASDPHSTYRELRYVRQKYITKDHLRAAIAGVANAIFEIRRAEIWGEGTTACASDSKKFGAWDQNLLTEWSIRHRGRGVMIYWHVERKSVCIYSQLKSASSSEVASMIEGVLRHCTDMTVEKNYTDSHGVSEVGFAFAALLGFELLPRLKPIGRQKLYRPEKGKPDAYPNLESVLTRPIDWDLIRNHYDQMVRYASALKAGTADAESILRRFARGTGGKDSPMHPVYRALAELGKAVKTIFLCRYLRSEPLRREIHEGLNTIERWNEANSFVFYGKGGEISTNDLEEQEVSVLSLHLLKLCLVYVNTLMIQQVLADPAWSGRMTPEDLRSLTPLIFHHVNPYDTFELDLERRIPLGEEAA